MLVQCLKILTTHNRINKIAPKETLARYFINSTSSPRVLPSSNHTLLSRFNKIETQRSKLQMEETVDLSNLFYGPFI